MFWRIVALTMLIQRQVCVCGVEKAIHHLIHQQLASILTSSVEVERRQHGVHSHGHGSHLGHGGLQGLFISLWEDVEVRAVARLSLDGVPALPFLQHRQDVLEVKH